MDKSYSEQMEEQLEPRPGSSSDRLHWQNVDTRLISRSALWPELSVHRVYWEQRNNALIYEYDPTDDGPEVEIIGRVLAAEIRDATPDELDQIVNWLNCKSWPATGPVDMLDHRRE